MEKDKFYLGVFYDKVDLNLYDHIGLLSMTDLIDMGVWFSEDGSDKVFVSNVINAISYERVIDLIEDFVIINTYSDEPDFEPFLTKVTNREICIIKKITDGFRIVTIEEIREAYSVLDNILEDVTDENMVNLVSRNMSDNNKRRINEFLNRIDLLVCGDECDLTLSIPGGVYYDITIMKYGGYLHNFCKSGDINLGKMNKNGLLYENGYENFKNLLYYYLYIDEVDVILNMPVSEGDISKMKENNERIVRKMFGFRLSLENDVLEILSMSSDKLLKMHKYDTETGMNLGINKNLVFCNANNKKDVICGFDLV